MKVAIAAVVIVLWCTFGTMAMAEDDPGQEYSVQLFLNACVSTYAHEMDVAAQAKGMGLAEITGDAAGSYLDGKTGRVWFGKNGSGIFAVSLLHNGLCTVFAHSGDGDRIRIGLESWLPPANSGVSVSKENIPAPPGITSTSYRLRGGKVREQWVLSISSTSGSALRAIMSYTGG
jgi:hypothetical protein